MPVNKLPIITTDHKYFAEKDDLGVRFMRETDDGENEIIAAITDCGDKFALGFLTPHGYHIKEFKPQRKIQAKKEYLDYILNGDHVISQTSHSKVIVSNFFKNQNKGVFVVSYNAEKNELASVAIIIVHKEKLYFYTSK